MNIRNSALLICLIICFQSIFAMEQPNMGCASEKKTGTSKIECLLFILPSELHLNIFLKILDLKNCIAKELPLALADFWSLAQTSQDNQFLAKEFLEVIVDTVYRIFETKGFIALWQCNMPEDHPIRVAILNYCQINRDTILKDLEKDNSSYEIDLEPGYSCINAKTYRDLTNESFMRIKCFIETGLITKEKKEALLNKIQIMIYLKRIANKTLPFLVAIIQLDKLGFNPFNKNEMELLDSESIKVYIENLDQIDAKIHQKNFFKAISNGDYKIVKILLPVIDINKKNSFGRTALREAVFKECYNICKLLLAIGVDVNQTDEYGATVLHYISAKDNLPIIKLLLDRSIKIDVKDVYGKTEIMYATVTGKIRTVRLLLKAGADINKQDNEGETALFKATNYGKSSIVKLLLENGADVNIKTTEGLGPLMAAAWNHNNETDKELFMLLLKNGAVIDPEWPAISTDEEVQNILIKNGAKVNPNLSVKDFQNRSFELKVANARYGGDCIVS